MIKNNLNCQPYQMDSTITTNTFCLFSLTSLYLCDKCWDFDKHYCVIIINQSDWSSLSVHWPTEVVITCNIDYTPWCFGQKIVIINYRFCFINHIVMMVILFPSIWYGLHVHNLYNCYNLEKVENARKNLWPIFPLKLL